MKGNRFYDYPIVFCQAIYLMCRYGLKGAMTHMTVELALQEKEVDDLLEETIEILKKRKGG